MRRHLCALVSAVVFAGSPGVGRATELAAMLPSEIVALEKRLADAGCYKGPFDGIASRAAADAVKACPDQDPVLRIETGMHVAPIRRMGIDAACRLLATGSYDKTVRLWAMPEGRLIRTVRLPIGPGDGGKIYAVTLSPDGRTLAAGGWDARYDGREDGTSKGNGLYVMDVASGGIRRVAAFRNVINHIAVSNDGAWIAAGLYGKNGVRVVERDTGREILSDSDYGDSIYGLAFAPDGSLVTVSYDGFLRRYGPDHKLAAKVKALDEAKPYAVAIDRDGLRVAIGYAHGTAVSIHDATTLALLAKGDTRDMPGGIFYGVAWSADGRQLVAGGSAKKTVAGKTDQRILRRFSLTGARAGADVGAAEDTISELKPCGGTIAFAAQDPRFGLIGADGAAHSLQAPVTIDARGKRGDAFTVSADATSIRFGLGAGALHPVRFDLAARGLTEEARPSPDLRPAVTTGMPVSDWQNGDTPKFNGAALPLNPYETSRALAIRPDHTGFVLAADWSLRAFDGAGHERWRTPAPGTTWGANVSGDGRIVVAAYGDGTIRWHRSSDGRELLALFVHVPTRRWVAWTPSGYYMASDGAEDLIGWHLNRGWDQEADFFPASRFRDKFNRPDVVRLVLGTLDEDEALKRADAAAGKRRDDDRPLIERLPPVITIVSPSDGSDAAPGTVEIRYSTRVPSGGAVDRVEAFVDGAKVESRGLARTDARPAAPADGMAGSISVPMPGHDAVVSLVAYSGGKASDAAKVQIKGAVAAGGGAARGEDALKPSLYALLVGVSHYDNKSFDLGFAADDATGLAAALKSQEGKLYRHVEVKVLTDKDASAVGVKRGISWLSKQTTARDLAIVFAAGHGMTDAKGKFWFLTSDADPEELTTTAVSRDDIADVLFDLPGKKLLFLDACHAGAALNAGVRGAGGTDLSAAVNDFAQAEGGVVAYAASTGKEFSLERDEWRHGAFTKALIEGFEGKADLLGKGTITTATLDAFLEDRVKELTGGAQHPVMTRPKTVPDFPLASTR